MTKLEDILDVNKLDEMRRDGYIRQASHPYLPLVSECYTKQAMFERAWTHETRTCRGLIWNTDTGDVIARPFSKFFNWGEPSCPEIDWDEQVRVYDKLDGSLGIVYPTPEGLAVATKNSFQSPQAMMGTAILRDRYSSFKLYPGFTTLVEIIYPDNRIVLDYGDVTDLFYLTDVNIETGRSCRVDRVPFPKPRLVNTGRFGRVIKRWENAERPNCEGVVIHVEGRDIRVKVKQKDYLELHKVCTGLNQKQLWKWLSEGKSIEEILTDIPEELHNWAFPILQDLCTKFTDFDISIGESWAVIQMNGWDKDRKALAELLKQVPKFMSHGIFLLMDNDLKRYNEMIWKLVKP